MSSFCFSPFQISRIYFLTILDLAGMKCLWEISIRSPLRETSQRPLRNISKVWIFCNVFKRRLKYISKKMSFVCVFKTSPRYLKKDVYSVTCPRRLKISHSSICGFSKIPCENGFAWFPLRYWNIWWNRCGTVRNSQEFETFSGSSA